MPRREPRPPQASHAGTAELLNGYRTTSLIVAAVQLGLPEHLAQGPVSPEPLAERVDADADALVRLLRGLAALGLVEENDDGHALTDAGAELLPGRPLRDLAVLVGEEYLPAWSRIADGVRTGRPAFPEVFGTGIWEHRERHPHLNDAFNRYLGRSEERAGEAIASVLDLDAARVIVDLGGGLGGVLAGLLRSDPRLEGILVDLPHVIEGASARLDAAGVLDRCRLVAGSFFERIPEGGDIYVLRYILHDWDDERAGAILRRCREAMHERA
ncbi:MAG TPA: methyltransferase, partial [Actinomycetota bacterium]|nr:methyltransferase [Actinomycetota bacterium]